METAMASKSLGAYIRALRRHMRPKVSQKKLAELADTTNNTIWRIEAGEQEPQEMLPDILTIIGGRIKDVAQLRKRDGDTALALRLAEEAITERQLLDWACTDEKRLRLLHRIREMSADDPNLRAQIDGYLDRHQGR